MAWAISPMNCRAKPPRMQSRTFPRSRESSDTKGGRPDHSHGAAAKDLSTVDTPATTIADNDAPGVRGEPPGHVNDKAQSGNADPGNNGLGHQPNELPSQASAHAVQDPPAVTGVDDTKGARPEP